MGRSPTCLWPGDSLQGGSAFPRRSGTVRAAGGGSRRPLPPCPDRLSSPALMLPDLPPHPGHPGAPRRDFLPVPPHTPESSQGCVPAVLPSRRLPPRAPPAHSGSTRSTLRPCSSVWPPLPSQPNISYCLHRLISRPLLSFLVEVPGHLTPNIPHSLCIFLLPLHFLLLKSVWLRTCSHGIWNWTEPVRDRTARKVKTDTPLTPTLPRGGHLDCRHQSWPPEGS